ncbi:rCG40941 [Rattus norvegicus]|uniref:Late cornified envelope 6A n=2 Tax=Rattus norvegicus TaxID=10116 RepID=A0A0G2JTC4_RAT|nr:late cornified envelope protein 6A [Rattus norvegicus]EDL87879.1 rCG40941 [Rattus norvegicus]|eukprot:XP_002729116.1 PREDICTED: late cornified envelope protein 6A [Rattus norvegicus]
MSQQKQQPSELPNAPKCSPPKGPNFCLTSCSSSCGTSCSAGYSSQLRRLGLRNTANRKKIHHPQPRCLRGGTTYHCKEEEC